ncbi:hypothetical protein [Neptunomonas marina]|uniref:Uncharacterized protein n=1 Tax=Neptunomonas marina TaxID=1815562 RepID=A0A437QEC2_9GAMM|nr:hypothetical protein [Neptunomonas marina]RVU32861.1 hypothetical protein EOE65_04180 [Neptunomonas marina]
MLTAMAAGAWYFYKPIRLFAPSFNDVVCVNHYICAENPASIKVAAQLYAEAAEVLQESIAKFDTPPKVIFCETSACVKRFGFNDDDNARTVGSIAILVGPKGWQTEELVHMMVHYSVNSRFGEWHGSKVPLWFAEGLAYRLTKTGGGDVSMVALKNYQIQFERWYQSVEPETFWESARAL